MASLRLKLAHSKGTADVRSGSWLCENARSLYRNRRSHLSKTVSGIQFENTFDLEIELKNVILVEFRFFAFLRSQGHFGSRWPQLPAPLSPQERTFH